MLLIIDNVKRAFACCIATCPPELDPPYHLLRIKLVCTLLDTCGEFFTSGPPAKKLDCYLVYFQVFLIYHYLHIHYTITLLLCSTLSFHIPPPFLSSYIMHCHIAMVLFRIPSHHKIRICRRELTMTLVIGKLFSILRKIQYKFAF